MPEDNTSPFPIQSDWKKKENRCIVPWWLAEIAYSHYVKLFGNDQSLERIAERGGFGREELLTLIRRERFHN